MFLISNILYKVRKITNMIKGIIFKFFWFFKITLNDYKLLSASKNVNSISGWTSVSLLIKSLIEYLFSIFIKITAVLILFDFSILINLIELVYSLILSSIFLKELNYNQ